jgi:predicted dehydrogenase
MLRLALIDASSAEAEQTAQASRRLRNVSSVSTAKGGLPSPADSCDAVVIHGSASSRMEIVRQAAMARKHILLATPGSLTFAELQAMIAACQAAEVTFTVGSPLCFRPSIAAVKAALESGKLGLPGLLRAHLWQPAEDGDTRLQALQLLELAVWMFGAPPTEVFATTNERVAGAAWPKYLQLHLGFPQNGMALLSSTANLAGTDEYETVSLIGSTGAAYADDQSQTQLVFREKSPRAIIERERIPTLAAELRDFQQAIADRRDPEKSLQWLIAALELMGPVQKSLADRQPIHLQTR